MMPRSATERCPGPSTFPRKRKAGTLARPAHFKTGAAMNGRAVRHLDQAAISTSDFASELSTDSTKTFSPPEADSAS